MPTIEAICISHEKGVIKEQVPSALLRTNWGIEGDAHAGEWHRQVSILASESIERMKALMPEIAYGMFAENLVTTGVDVTALRVGDQLRIGSEVVLCITQIGKECHNGACAIEQATGKCIMPTEGLFCRVLHGGTVQAGMLVEVMPQAL
uniref:MOSC domain-containing protein n=1 Tax=Chlorobium chlorochromatii (strain CaD3) TaxID=340177 RepID=Q3ATJ2_CHLCH